MVDKIKNNPMKKIVIIFLAFLVLIVLGCEDSKFKGYVCDENGKPISNVAVREIHLDKIVKTDSLGYFELKFSYSNPSSHLIFSKEGYKIDTFKFLRLHPPSIVFSRKYSDTLFMKKK